MDFQEAEDDPKEQELDAQPGEQLRALRRSREVSQRHLAELAGVDQSVICRLEKGADARWATWKRLFSALAWKVVLRPEAFTEEFEGLLEDGTKERKERREAGLAARWG